jgi:hypothetical protein
MTVRVGESWQARNGHRRWVSAPLRDVLALGLVGALFFLPFWLTWNLVVWSLWVYAEVLVFLFTAIAALVVVAGKEARLSDLTMTRLKWGLWMVDLKGRQ